MQAPASYNIVYNILEEGYAMYMGTTTNNTDNSILGDIGLYTTERVSYLTLVLL
jgi:hypothetical protein